MTTPNLGLAELVANQSQPHVPINQSLRLLDALVQVVAIDILTAPPGGTPQDGDTYLADTGSTGLWAGFDEYLVYWQTNAWHFIQPKIGWRCYLASVAQDYRFSVGSPSGWAPIAEGGGGGVSRLADLEDVDLANLNDGYSLVWNEADGKFEFVSIAGGGGVSHLADLEDVDLANLNDGYALVWNETDGKFEFVSIAAGGTINITDLADVLPGSPGFADGDTLSWDAGLGKFIPRPAASGADTVASTILLHFDGANGDTTTVDDGVGGFPVTFHGGAALSTTQKKFGATSLQCTGTGGVSIPLADINLSDPGFTWSVDMWIYPTVNADSMLIGQWGTSGLSWLFGYISGTFALFYSDGGGSHFPSWTSVPWTLNTWQHVAISRVNDNVLLYLNGVYEGKITLSAGSVLTTPIMDLTVGYSPTSAPNTGSLDGYTGYIDEVRLLKGRAVWSQTFTPPTAPYDQ